ncbi:MAG: Hsp70 family protein [Breznakia sp.]
MIIIGIDLGTTNSLVSVFKDGKVELIPNQFNEYLTPSVVSVHDDGVIVGKIAKERIITDNDNTVAAFKTFMGSDKIYNLNGQGYTPIDLSAMVIRQLVQDAENYLGEKIEEAVISVPAYFNDVKRLATKQAGEVAGIRVDRIINEPSAAALASRINQTSFEKLLIFDIGGGTLDVSVVDCFENIVEIISVSGDNHLGGEDFNQAIEDFVIETHNLYNLSSKESAILTRHIEELKKDLSLKDESSYDLYLDDRKITISLTNESLLEIFEPLLARIKGVVKKALKDAQMSVVEVDRLIMVGGSSRLTVVQEYLEYLFEKKPEVSGDVDYLIGMGCGYVAGIKERNSQIKDKVLTDICPFSLGIEVSCSDNRSLLFSAIIDRNTTLPCSKVERYKTNYKGQKQIEVKIYQGEESVADKNQFLGSLTVDIPQNRSEHELVDVRFTYDINGILDVDVNVVSTGEGVQKVFFTQATALSSEDIEKKTKDIKKIKMQIIEDEVLEYIIERASRIFEESIGSKREMAASIIVHTKNLKRDGKLATIEQAKIELLELLDSMESQSPFAFESPETKFFN